MKHEKLIKIKAIPYHSYNMVVYSTKIDEYGELVPYRQMILARRKSSDVLVERNVLRTAYNNNNNEHQGHKMTHLINDMSSSNNNIYLKIEHLLININQYLLYNNNLLRVLLFEHYLKELNLDN